MSAGKGVKSNGIENGLAVDKEEQQHAASNRKRAIPQFLAASANNLLLLDLGMTLAFPTLVIASLLNSSEKGSLEFDSSTASWFGGVTFLCQPVGSIVSGFFVDSWGRKKCMLFVNIPRLLGWYMYYLSPSVAILFLAGILMGLGAGFMEAPVITYNGEISEPRLRGTLISFSSSFVIFGLLLEYFLGSVYHWQTAAFISSFLPIIAFFAILQIPETPQWLLSQGRIAEAEKSLSWLRGWVTPEDVQDELNEMVRYGKASEQENKHPNLKEKMKYLLQPAMFKPLSIAIMIFVFFQGTGYPATRPYLVKVLEELHVPFEAHWAAVIMSCNSFVGLVVCTLTINFLGKRKLLLMSLAGCALITLSLSFITFTNFPKPYSSTSYMAGILYFLLAFLFSLGTESIPWILVSEIFPYQGRGTGSAISAASSYLLGFLTTKTFLSLKDWVGLSGLYLFYGLLTVVGVVWIFFKLPETERKSLEEIEEYFKEKEEEES